MAENRHYALAREAILAALTAFTGITTADGATPGNNTLICSSLIGKNDFITGKAILIGSGDAKYEDSGALSFATLTGTITVVSAFNKQIKAGTTFRILNISSVEIDVASIEAKVDALGGATGLFNEQADVAVNINAIAASETDVFHLAVADTRYIVRTLRLKCANPGANTVTVRLYELVNDVLTEVDSFAITGANFGTYFNLVDLFGADYLAGDELQVTVRASAGGPYAVTGQYSFGKTNV